MAAKKKATVGQRISASNLSQLSGISTRWIFDLAKAAGIKTEGGEYELEPILKCLFDYYRKKLDSSLMVNYSSMQQCASSTGIPIKIISLAKRNGCEAITANNTVKLKPLIAWLFSQNSEDSDINWANELNKEKAKREKIKRMKDEGSTVDREFVESNVKSALSVVFAELDREFCNVLPPTLKGLNEIQIRNRNMESIEDLKDTLRKRFEDMFQG